MPVRIVQSKQNARLKELRRALATPPRDSGRRARTLAGVEGLNLVEEALHSGLRVPCVFAAQDFENLLQCLPLPPDAEVLLMPRAILDSALATQAPQPIAALVEPPDWTWAHLLDSHRKSIPLIAILAGIQDPGNLGTILRSAEAFGADGVLALPGAVSAWNPKAVRASAGSVFRLPLVTASIEDCVARLHEAGVRIWTTTVRAAKPADLVDLAAPVALIFGNEGSGVPPEVAAIADGSVTIPCPGAVESLNAAVAASVLLYEAARQRGGNSARSLDLRGSTL